MGFVFLLFIDKFILGTFELEINDKNPVYLNTTLDLLNYLGCTHSRC